MDVAGMVDSDWHALLRRLGVELEASARQHKALQGRRGVPDSASLLRLALVYGGTPLSLRTTAGWANAAGIASVSDVALLYRLQACEAWLAWIFAQALSLEMQALAPVSLAGSAAHCWRLRAIDGTVIKRTEQLAHPGWRLHAAYDLAAGRFDDLQLAMAGEGERLDRFEASPGDILVADRGFGRARALHAIAEAGAHFIVRRGTRACGLLDAGGATLDEAAILALAEATDTEPVDIPVQLVPSRYRLDKSKIPAADYARLEPLACRLIIKRLPPEAAASATKRTAHTARRKRQQPSPERIPAARFVYLLTNLPIEAFDAEPVCHAYRWRWQIELAFKRLKSLAHLDQFEAVDERLVKTVLYAKLIIALLSQTLVAHIIALSPSIERADER